MNIKISRKFIILLSILAFAVVFYFCFPILRGNKNKSHVEGLGAFKVEAFQEKAGWAYRIYQDTVPVIEQISVPGVTGNTGFKSKEDAENTGRLVKLKLDRGIFPPTVSKHELDSMGVSY